jgi:hypothetical protein
MEGKRATARRERGQQGKAHRQNEKIILYNTEHTHTHTQMFSEYRRTWRTRTWRRLATWWTVMGYSSEEAVHDWGTVVKRQSTT